MKSVAAHDTFELARGELCVHFHGNGALVLLDGAATIFGSPMRRNVRYRFHQCGVAVRCVHTCRIDVHGEARASPTALTTDDSDLHALLDLARADSAVGRAPRADEAADGASADLVAYALTGPRVLVVGPSGSGKTTLCRTLVNAACSDPNKRYGVALVGADVAGQCLTMPGSVATVFVDAPLAVEDAFVTQGPLAFFVGGVLITAGLRRRYLDLCALTAQAVASVAASRPAIAHGGCIVDAGCNGPDGKPDRDLIIQLVSIFRATHIVVTGSDVALSSFLRESLALAGGGVVLNYRLKPSIFGAGTTEDTAAAAVSRNLVSYFAGSPRTRLSPCRVVVYTKDVHFLDAATCQPVEWSELRPLSVAAVSWADALDHVADSNVAGYVVLLEVGKKACSMLVPASGTLPRPFLLVSPTLAYPAHAVPPFSAATR